MVAAVIEWWRVGSLERLVLNPSKMLAAMNR